MCELSFGGNINAGALVETSTLVRKCYDKNCLHHDLEVLNNPVPPPSTPFLPTGDLGYRGVRGAVG